MHFAPTGGGDEKKGWSGLAETAAGAGLAVTGAGVGVGAALGGGDTSCMAQQQFTFGEVCTCGLAQLTTFRWAV